jgi:hypothetical protein
MVGGALLNHIDQYDFSLTIIHVGFIFSDTLLFCECLLLLLSQFIVFDICGFFLNSSVFIRWLHLQDMTLKLLAN